MLAFAVSGLAVGGTYALLGLTLTVVFQTTRTVNFAAAGTGAFGTFVLATTSAAGVPFWLALPAGMVVGAALSTLLGLALVLWFDQVDVQRRSVATIAALISMLAVAGLIFGGKPQPVPTVFTAIVATVDGATVTQSTIIIIAVAVVLAAAVGTLLQRTVLGKRLRAVSERPATAELLGIPARAYGLWVWALAGAFGVVAVTLVAATNSTDYGSLSLLVVPALAAALAGLFRSLTATVAGGLLLGMAQGAVAGSPTVAPYSSTVPFVVLLLVLLYSQRSQRWEDAR